MIINQDRFEDMKAELEEMINRNAAGLDDITLKKMLLTYYRGIYFDDTTVRIQLTNEDLGLTVDEFKELFSIREAAMDRGAEISAIFDEHNSRNSNWSECSTFTILWYTWICCGT